MFGARLLQNKTLACRPKLLCASTHLLCAVVCRALGFLLSLIFLAMVDWETSLERSSAENLRRRAGHPQSPKPGRGSRALGF